MEGVKTSDLTEQWICSEIHQLHWQYKLLWESGRVSHKTNMKPMNDRYSGISNQYRDNQDDLNLCNKLSIHNLAFETFTSVILLLFVLSFWVGYRLWWIVIQQRIDPLLMIIV